MFNPSFMTQGREAQTWSMVAASALKAWKDRNTFPALYLLFPVRSAVGDLRDKLMQQRLRQPQRQWCISPPSQHKSTVNYRTKELP